MPIRREFIDWRLPALAAAATWLAEKHSRDGRLDLARVIVALPGARAGRRLLELLVDQAERQSLAFSPPRIITVGKLPELLYVAKRPFAADFAQQMAWVEALRSLGEADLSRLVRVPPADDDLDAWRPLGAMLSRLHTELAADQLDFAAVARRGRELETFDEAARWRVLQQAQQRYLKILDELGLWDLQTARLVAIEDREAQSNSDIVLVGAVDLDSAQRAILDQVADRVTAIVFAPESLADRFDEHGCLKHEAWQRCSIDIPLNQVEQVDGPGEAADAVARALASLSGSRSGEEITIGALDEELAPYIIERLDECGVATRLGAGTDLTRSAPYRLLAALADYLEGGSAAALASLARHPAIGAYVASRGVEEDWLSPLDEYYSQRFPARTTAREVAEISDGPLATACTQIARLAAGLEGARSLAEWRTSVAAFLVNVYGQRSLARDVEPDRSVVLACEKIVEKFDELAAINKRLCPELPADQAIRLVLDELLREKVAPPGQPGAIEIVGWLETPLDDAPTLVLAGLNEGIVPAARNSDLFLPNELRRRLAVEDNERRYARDAYALSLLVASRPDLRIIVPRRTAEGEPLLPSRLLFARPEEELAERARALFGAARTAPARIIVPGGLRAARAKSNLPIPRPAENGQVVTSMKITEFRDFLACPYRYYLRHRLGLETLGDAAAELDAADFGSLAHEVLKEFGRSSVVDSTDPREIEATLNFALAEIALERFGEAPSAAVMLQIEQLRMRLAGFALWQAEWRLQGWRIKHVEKAFSAEQAAIVVDEAPMYLRGRIDRIDVHESREESIVFDYKTGDAVTTPEKAHRKHNEWIDLQLPLYRRLVGALDIPQAPRLGYIALPKDTQKIGPLLAEWSAAELAGADDRAADVVRLVRRGVFWPPASPPPAFSEDFAAICQDGVFGVELAEAAETEAP